VDGLLTPGDMEITVTFWRRRDNQKCGWRRNSAVGGEHNRLIMQQSSSSSCSSTQPTLVVVVFFLLSSLLAFGVLINCCVVARWVTVGHIREAAGPSAVFFLKTKRFEPRIKSKAESVL